MSSNILRVICVASHWRHKKQMTVQLPMIILLTVANFGLRISILVIIGPFDDPGPFPLYGLHFPQQEY